MLLDLPAAPLVSVCMVTYGARDWVECALDALVAHTPAGRYEIVVVDNASPDGAGAFVRDYAARAPVPMHVEQLDRNVGFAAGHDLAANLARGSVLCLLNSDAIVPDGWLDALLAPMLADASVAATLPLFVDIDGRLQEAGANVEPDGRVEAFGIRGDPEHDEWSWPRRVTYGSAACWITRTATFRTLGGLDAGYGLGYYEDVDFAFELARRGMRLELVPTVRVVHAQGASSPSSEIAVQRRDANQARFVARQSSLLAHRWHTLDIPNEPHRYFAARDVDVAHRVLLVTDSVPAREHLPVPRGTGTRVTVAVPTSVLQSSLSEVRDLRAAGVEVVADPERAVRERLFLLDEVVAAPSWLDDRGGLLAAWQPQAALVAVDPVDA